MLLDGAVKAIRTLDYATGLTDDPTAELTRRLPTAPPAPSGHGYIDDNDVVAPHLAISVEPVEIDGAVFVYAWDLTFPEGCSILVNGACAVAGREGDDC